jgi:hypothetical protein
MNLDIGNGASEAATRALDALAAGSRAADERSMGAIARQALFAEALLGALKAHVNELKSVAK